MNRPNLLLCFDAFGTLFKPRKPLPQQYLEVAGSFGIKGVTEGDLASTFKDALKSMKRIHPNYGQTTGMLPETWWTHVIETTFRPYTGNQSLPRNLAPALLRRFASREGYALTEPALPSALRFLKGRQNGHLYNKLVVGVLSNSDDRVPLVLSSLGLHVGPLRYGNVAPGPYAPPSHGAASQEYDVDFHCLSYDVRYEKPDPRIFQAAEQLCCQKTADEEDMTKWYKILVGDDGVADVGGALAAGWQAVYLPSHPDLRAVAAEAGMEAWPMLTSDARTLEEAFAKPGVPVTATLASFLRWLQTMS
jgi:FMN phosphatase YigB (HAD superfamily)